MFKKIAQRQFVNKSPQGMSKLPSENNVL